MASPRLTGLEFQWFTQSQLLATNYQQSWRMDLEPSLSTLVSSINEDARSSLTGPQSLQRLAIRLEQSADEIAAEDFGAPPRTNGRFEADRRITALRCLAAKFVNAAGEVVASNRDAPAEANARPN
ncbi:hypothetical protein J2X36_004527 [Methylobacterium sp. BE186]|uniref:hypothetical protein n=1 Tax=Methylobacterium sp. BE186 TaxID=2817715 RepID=UPI00285855E2|nr:hypothetical protein [Methylobacterium sp. BE186]MDR7039749.1 hypothetical protein [Methylobacterium sp. BE186]